MCNLIKLLQPQAKYSILFERQTKKKQQNLFAK